MARTRLTKQEKKFVEIKAETGNGTLAVQEAFGIEDPNYAGVKALRLLRKDKIVKAIHDALPDDLLAERHLELLNKRDLYTYHTEVKLEDGKKEVKVHKIDLGPEVTAVSKGLDMAYKIRGDYAPEKHAVLTKEVDVKPTDRVDSLLVRITNRRGEATTD